MRKAMDTKTSIALRRKDRNASSDRESAISRQPRTGCRETWEDAYSRFETPEEERRKFHARFCRMGVTLDIFIQV
jgi:hypothetical protein